MLNCFDNYIGLEGVCDADPPKSGMYINSADGGINLDFLSSIASDRSGASLFALKSAYVYERAVQYAKTAIQTSVQLNDVAGIAQLGKFTESYLPFVPLERGIQIKRAREKSLLQRIKISYVRVQTNTAGTFDLKVIDGAQTTIYPFTVVNPTVPVDVEVDYLCYNQTVRVVIDNTNVSVNAGRTPSCYTGCRQDDCCGESLYAYNQWDIETKGWNGTSADNLCYGISASITVVCDLDRLICQLRDSFKYVIFHELAIELLRSAFASPNMNLFTRGERLEQISAAIEKHKIDLDNAYNIANSSLKYALRNISDKQCIICKGISLHSVI